MESAMVKGKHARIVLVTCGTLKEGRRIARALVEKRLAACVNIALTPVESIYTWKGKMKRSREFLLIIKTTAKSLSELEKEIKRLHSYDVPEFLALPVVAGSKEYLAWLDKNVVEDRLKSGKAIRQA